MATGGEIGGVEEQEAGAVPGMTHKQQQPDADTGSTDNQQQSDAVREYTCSPCGKNDVTTVATHYCPECDVCYCKACLCDHAVLGRSKVAQWGKSDTEGTGSHTQAEVEENTCLRHPGHVVTMYCVGHDVLCCQICSSTDHRPCKNMDKLSVAADNDDLDDTVRNVEAEIASLERNTETLANDSESRAKFVESSHSNYTNQLEKMKKKLIAKFDKVTKEALERKQHYINKFNTDKQVCMDITEKLSGLKMSLKPTEDKQKGFMRAKRAREWVRDKQGEMETILNATVTEVFQNIPCAVEARSLKVVSGDIDVKMAEMKFSIETKLDRKECEIVGLCQIANGHTIIADTANICLKQLDEGYSVVSRYQLQVAPQGICAIGDSEVAVVMNNKKILIIVVGTAFENIRTLELDHPCTNVAFYDDKLYVTNTPSCSSYRCNCKAQIHILDKSGKVLGQMTADIGQHYQPQNYTGAPICISEDGEKTYVALHGGLAVLDSQGQKITSSKNYAIITGLYVDSKGGIYASLGESTEIVKLSQQGTENFKRVTGTVLSSLEEATAPGVIGYDKRLGRIVICQRKGSYIYLEKHTY